MSFIPYALRWPIWVCCGLFFFGSDFAYCNCPRAVLIAARFAQQPMRRMYSQSVLDYFQARGFSQAVEVEIGQHLIERFNEFMTEQGVTFDSYATAYANFLLGLRPAQDFFGDPLGERVPPPLTAEQSLAMQNDPFFSLPSEEVGSADIDLTSPPLAPEFTAPDSTGFRQFLAERTHIQPELRDRYEQMVQSVEGMQRYVDTSYEILIQYRMDKKLRQQQSSESKARAQRLAQRRVPLEEVLIFYSPTPEQQEEWALKLKESRWKNVPRLVWLEKEAIGEWIVDESFRSQIDLVRIDPRLPGAQPIACLAKNILIVGAGFMDGEELGSSLRSWRDIFVRDSERLEVTLLDFGSRMPTTTPLGPAIEQGWNSIGLNSGEDPAPLLLRLGPAPD